MTVRHPDCMSDPPSIFDTDRGCEVLAEAIERELGYPDHLASEIVEAARYDWSDDAIARLVQSIRRDAQAVIDAEQRYRRAA